MARDGHVRAIGRKVTGYARREMIRFVWSVAALAALLVVTACGGAPAATPARTLTLPTLRPNPTEPPVTTFLPITTPEFTFGPLPTLDDSTGSLDNGNDWPTTVSTTLSPGKFTQEFANGSFTDAGPARECGPNLIYPTGFLFGFPHDLGSHAIDDITFSALELTPGTTATTFFISVNISEEAGGGVHPATVLDTSDTRSGAAGTAQLSEEGGVRHLVVQASDSDGIEIHLTATCTKP